MKTILLFIMKLTACLLICCSLLMTGASASGRHLPVSDHSMFYAPEKTLSGGGIVGDTAACEGDVRVYSYPFTPGFSYTWSVTNGSGVSSGNVFTVTWGSGTSGSVYLIVKDALGHVVFTQTLGVTFHPRPNPFITASFSPTCEPKPALNDNPGAIKIGPPPTKDSCLRACDSSVINYTSPLNAGSTYTWTVSGAISYTPSANTVSVYWGAPGNGMISVTETNAYGCKTTVQKCVRIIPSPHASFTSVPVAVSGVITICKGQTVQFYDNSNPGGGSPLFDWTWHFGDGGTSTLKNPAHTYDSAGYDTVIMYVENECHCKDSFVAIVHVINADAPIIQCISTVCANDTASYSTPSGCAGATYTWNVTGGTITTTSVDHKHINVQWGSSGPGMVSLLITGCDSCPVPAIALVSIISPTTTITGADPACPSTTGSSYTYSIPVMGGCTYSWTITPSTAGNILKGAGTNAVEVEWVSGTTATIAVTYNNPSLNCGGSASKLIHIKPPFTISGSSTVCAGTSNSYIAPGLHPTTYSWKVVDATNTTVFTGSGSNVFPVTWSWGAGLFTVIASQSAGDFCNSPQSFPVTVVPAPPPVTAITGPSPVCPGIPYDYTASPTGPGYFLYWQAVTGSPSTASGSKTSVAWSGSGPYSLKVYQVSMTAPSCTSSVFTLPVSSKIPPPAFTVIGPGVACGNSNGVYKCTLPFAADDYIWTITPTRAGSVISGAGTGTVTIQWSNGTAPATISVQAKVCGTLYGSTPLNITFTNPTVGVSAGSGPYCQNSGVTFTATPGGTSYNWDFGDGTTTSTATNSTSHVYAASGTYGATVSVSNLGGCPGPFSASTSLTINPAPNATLTVDASTSYCGLLNHNIDFFVNTTSGASVTWFKNGSSVGSGNTYTILSGSSTAPGDYYAIVVLNGCSTQTKDILVSDTFCTPPPSCTLLPGASISFTYSASCNNLSFTGTMSGTGISPQWDFGDGATATGTSASHTYVPGYYTVVFSALFPKVGGGYCKLVTAQAIVVGSAPDFKYSVQCPSAPGNGYRIQFVDQSTTVSPYTVSSWSWSNTGGTPSTSGISNPTVDYAPGGGTYNVILDIGGGCVDILPVKVPATPNLVISATPNPVCEGSPVSFSTTGSGTTVVNWLWDFGDLSTSAKAAPVRSYTYSSLTSPPFANVTLNYIDAYGCNFSAVPLIVTVNQNMVTAGITPPSGASCDSFMMNALPGGGTSPYTFLWSTTETTPSIYAKQSGAYFVEVTDHLGCRVRSNGAAIRINPKPQAIIFGKTNYCSGEKLALNCNTGSTPPYTYQWIVDGSLFSIPGPVLNTILITGTHRVRVIVTDTTTGCFDTSAVDTIIVHSLPSVTASSAPSPACAGSPITITASTTALPPYYNWSNGGSTNPIVVTGAGDYSIVVTDQYGCESNKDSAVVHPLPDFSSLMTGCYEFCDTGNVPLVGPYDPSYAYQWYLNGVAIAGGTGRTYNVPVGANGIYTLVITTSSGCVDSSGTIDVTFIHCGALPPCSSDGTTLKIVCLGIDSAGNPRYYFDYDFGWSGTNNSPIISFTSPQGVISDLSTNYVLSFAHSITGIFTDLPSFGGGFRFTIVIYDSATHQYCSFSDSIPFPTSNCIMQHCDMGNANIGSVVCDGFDINGNQKYTFNFNLVSPFGGTPTNIYMSSPTGGFSAITPSSITGAATVSAEYVALSTASPMCFMVMFENSATGLTCIVNLCVTLPHCNAFTGFAKRGDTTYLGMDNVIAGGTSTLQLFPNPTRNISTVTYTFSEKADNMIIVTDMFGKRISIFDKLTGNGSIELNTSTLSAGVYTVTAYTGNKQVQTKRLIVVK